MRYNQPLKAAAELSRYVSEKRIMGLIRCTKKLLGELKIKPCDQTEQSGRISSWHANLLRFDRRKCVLFTNDQTLFSFLVVGMKKPQFENFHEVFRQNLFKNLLWENFPQNQIEIVLEAHLNIEIGKTNNRSVLGSMNDLAFQLEYKINSSGGLEFIDLARLNHELNRIPMSAIAGTYSIDEIKKLFGKLST